MFTAWRSVGRLWICSYDLLGGCGYALMICWAAVDMLYDLLGGCGYALWSVGRLWICFMICWAAVDMLYDLLASCGYALWSVGWLWICSMICWASVDIFYDLLGGCGYVLWSVGRLQMTMNDMPCNRPRPGSTFSESEYKYYVTFL